MTEIREILRRLQLGERARRIARDLEVSRNTVAHYRQWAATHGLLTGPLPEPAALAELLAAPPGERPAQEQSLVEPFREQVLAWHAKDVEGQAIWQLLVEQHGFEGSYSSVKRFLRRVAPPTPRATLRLEVDPGEEAQVDYDLGIGRGLRNFDYLRTVGQRINGRVLEAERVAHDCGLAASQLADLVLPTRTPDGQPAPALKFGQPRVTALLGALCLFATVPEGITNGRVRPQVAQLLGVPPAQYTARQMGYDRRRLARKGLLQRVDGKLCYTLTPFGRRVALFLTKVHGRVLRPGLHALDLQITAQVPPPLRMAFIAFDAATDALIKKARLAA